jgi:hypothetical protein
MKGDIAGARQTLQSYMRQYGDSNMPYMEQVRQRLNSLQ